MKRILSVFAFAALLASCGFAQDIIVEKPTAAEGGAEMKFDSREIDYGVIDQNSEPYRKFTFTNTGDEPLQITNAKGSCGCTVPEWPKEPIFPGETNEIKVRYDTKRIGKFAKRVTLTTNVVGDPIVLTIKGDVKAPKPEPDGVPAGTPSILSPSGSN